MKHIDWFFTFLLTQFIKLLHFNTALLNPHHEHCIIIIILSSPLIFCYGLAWSLKGIPSRHSEPTVNVHMEVDTRTLKYKRRQQPSFARENAVCNVSLSTLYLHARCSRRRRRLGQHVAVCRLMFNGQRNMCRCLWLGLSPSPAHTHAFTALQF
jgi:hypothetical protein